MTRKGVHLAGMGCGCLSWAMMSWAGWSGFVSAGLAWAGFRCEARLNDTRLACLDVTRPTESCDEDAMEWEDGWRDSTTSSVAGQ